MSDSLSYITTLYGTSSDTTSTLLDTLYGLGSSSGSSSGTDPVQALQQAEQNQAQDIAMTAAQPAVMGTLAAFAKAVNGATSLDQVLSNPTVMQVLLTANGMSDQIGYTALAKAALTSNPSDSASLVNQLSDTRWKALAENYNFAGSGLSAIQNASAIAQISQQYAKAVWETNEDQVAPGLSDALYFKANASSVTSVDQILGDPTLRTVVTTALGIPEQIAFQSLTTQEKAIADRLDISKLQDPKFVEQFTQQYLIENSANSSSSSTSSTDLTTLAIQAGGILV